ncbi:MAG TPA: hypothetical protein DDW17_05490 [Deltaproteobacteria bacterium]|nr:hypothetical protein [Deltaproteobacteria bacterium]
MDINQFLLSLLHALSSIDFAEHVDFQTEVFIFKGHIALKKERILQVYFNEITRTTAFALIEEDKRIWGVDFDHIRGWHLHPVGNPESHQTINSMTIEEIIKTLAEAWSLLK